MIGSLRSIGAVPVLTWFPIKVVRFPVAIDRNVTNTTPVDLAFSPEDSKQCQRGMVRLTRR